MAGKYNSPQSGSVACAIGKVTFLEMIRDRVFYNVVLCAFVLLGLGYLGSKLTFVRPNRVVLDFGISAIFLACALVAIFTGSGLINKEIERRTIHVALCHPISRDQFVYGKFLGLSWVVTLNWLALCCCFLAILFFTTQDRADFSPALFQGLLLIGVQANLVCGITLFFSAFTTTALAAIMSLGVFLVGNSVSHLHLVASKIPPGARQTLVKYLIQFLPNLEVYHLGFQVTYGLPVESKWVAYCCLYGLVYTVGLVLAAGIGFRFRQI